MNDKTRNTIVATAKRTVGMRLNNKNERSLWNTIGSLGFMFVVGFYLRGGTSGLFFEGSDVIMLAPKSFSRVLLATLGVCNDEFGRPKKVCGAPKFSKGA
ncbi:MAG: hypothetical protein K8R88_11510 [Armatimonadetes bacterium]|nr:hypothetical protein [Armatimonadota bacterium]